MSSNTVINQGEPSALDYPANPDADSDADVRMESRHGFSSRPASPIRAWGQDRGRYDWMDWHSFSDYQG
ncbi:hypothetical protein [Paraburkholderia phytofirmans]|uniref:hypothetical protein n=1 Tax=Paraburkholderia phytofirmans TaxID=261302 RepID=UPI001314DBA0|nr:hypothetical protein [Paraburkholderia phytofirmans]